MHAGSKRDRGTTHAAIVAKLSACFLEERAEDQQSLVCRQDGLGLACADDQGDDRAREVADEGYALRSRLFLALALVKDLGAAGHCGCVVLAQALGHLDIGAGVGGRVLDYTVVVDVGHFRFGEVRPGLIMELEKAFASRKCDRGWEESELILCAQVAHAGKGRGTDLGRQARELQRT